MTGTTPRGLPLPRYVRAGPAPRPSPPRARALAAARGPAVASRYDRDHSAGAPPAPLRARGPRRPHPRRLPRLPQHRAAGAPADAGRPAAPAHRGPRPGARRGPGPAPGAPSLGPPRRPPAALPHRLAEVTGPVLGEDRVRPTDADLTWRNGGEAVGQRILVHGRVLDSDGRPVPGALVEVWQANASGRYRHVVDTW